MSALSLLVFALVFLADEAVTPRPWTHEHSDIEVNPRITFGTLDNGLRWAWMANPEPDRRSYLRLVVDVGSAAERDDEQGLAHFVEHMAFNGTENFEAGALVEWFQAHGMRFGAHLNASTGFEQTTYSVDLPESDETSLQEALAVLADFAGGLLIEPEEVAAEIGVIDGEERERDSARYRVQVEALRRQMDGTRVAERLPIGKREVRATFDAPRVREFYERWYRPERMTLVLVGDLQGLDPAPLIEQALGALEAPEGEATPLPEMGRPTFAQPVFALYNDEVSSLNITLARLRPWEEQPFTREGQLEELPLQVARAMVNTRFSELSRQPGNPFLSAGLGDAESFDLVDGEALTLVCEPERWQEALAAAEQELRRAVLYGFRQAELDEIRANWRRGLDEAVEREATRSSASYAGELVRAASDVYVPATAATGRDVILPGLEAATPEGCHAALVEAWSRGRRSLIAIGGLDLGEGAEEQLLAALEASREVEVSPPEVLGEASFAYASGDEPGEIAERGHVEDLDVHQVRFANGVRLNLKATDYKLRQILVTARIGEGQLALAPEQSALVFGAAQLGALAGMGLKAHSVDDMRRLMAGRRVGGSLGVADDHFALGAATTAEDLLLQCEVMCATLEHPGWRDETFRQAREQVVPLIYEQLEHDVRGPMQTDFLPALHGGDPRWGLPGQEQVQEVTMEAIAAWVGPQLEDGPVEVSMVGDLDVEAAIEVAARTFGRLPERRAPQPWDEHRQVRVTGGIHQEHEVDSEVPNASLFVAFPTTDGFDAATRRALRMLGVVYADRLRKVVREELGEAYSPAAVSNASGVFPGLGFLQVRADAEPGRAEQVLEASLRIADDLKASGVTEQELARLRAPEMKTIRDSMRQNGFWLGIIEQCGSRPERLEELRRMIPDYEEMDAETLSELAERYLDREAASWVIVRPRPPLGDG